MRTKKEKTSPKRPSGKQRIIQPELPKESKLGISARLKRFSAVGFPCHAQSGFTAVEDARGHRKQAIIRQVSRFTACGTISTFSRRVTALEWHPTDPLLMAAGSKGGDIQVWRKGMPYPERPQILGAGPGGSIQSLRFDPVNVDNVYIASLTGQFSKVNYVSKKSFVYLNTNDFNKWFLSCDVSLEQKLMVAGDTDGMLSMMSLDGSFIGKFKLHKKTKITNVEFSKVEPWLICTSSNDKTVKLWDVRKLECSGLPLPIVTMENTCPVNSAHFSRVDGRRLLVTDQHNCVNIYRGPLFHLERTILHPHRQFQHLTYIRADWHPHEDIVVIGRYPDPKFEDYEPGELRTVDLFDADSGKLLCQLSGDFKNGIKPLNKFSATGETLASASGAFIYFSEAPLEDTWQDCFDYDKKNTIYCRIESIKSLPSRKVPLRGAKSKNLPM